MTDEMLALAQANAAEAGVANAIFLKGVIEEIPLPAASVDVIISNCVINLSVDKAAVLTEMARVLRSRAAGSASPTSLRRTASRRPSEPSAAPTPAASRARCRVPSTKRAWRPRVRGVEVTFTHEVADGMHGAIVKAVKTREPEQQGLPIIRQAASAGCC